MPDFVSDGRADRLAGAGVYPQCPDGVVVARAGSQPFFLIQQVYLHLVLVQIRFALSRFGEAQFVDVGGIKLFGFFQQVVDIHPHVGRHGFGIGVIAEAGFPEYEEVFALLRAEPRPLRVVAQHVHVAELGRLVIFLEVFYL